jgi:hypothetical protein
MPKSILKKSAGAANTDFDTSSDITQESWSSRARLAAIQQAHIIQQQKDVQAQILEAIESLLELPHSSNADPNRPAKADVDEFIRLISIFQPSDFDALVEERFCAGKCGYVLCPRNITRDGGKSGFRIVKTKGASSCVVPRASLQQWCSENCTKRALYVKVQLNEEPAWTRRALNQPELSLYADTASELTDVDMAGQPVLHDNQENVTIALAQLALHDHEENVTKNLAELALKDSGPT